MFTVQSLWQFPGAFGSLPEGETRVQFSNWLQALLFKKQIKLEILHPRTEPGGGARYFPHVNVMCMLRNSTSIIQHSSGHASVGITSSPSEVCCLSGRISGQSILFVSCETTCSQQSLRFRGKRWFIEYWRRKYYSESWHTKCCVDQFVKEIGLSQSIWWMCIFISPFACHTESFWDIHTRKNLLSQSLLFRLWRIQPAVTARWQQNSIINTLLFGTLQLMEAHDSKGGVESSGGSECQHKPGISVYQWLNINSLCYPVMMSKGRLLSLTLFLSPVLNGQSGEVLFMCVCSVLWLQWCLL